MKRYEIGRDRGMGCFMEESPTGEYHSRADLIAAGVLVPVPDGEACRVEALYDEERLVRHDGKIYFGDNDGSSYAALADTKPDFPDFTDDTIVQPVRLVRLEDVDP
jgi:hypothetical protein